MAAYYNEFDPAAAAWLKILIERGLIAPGDVDERSITDVRPDDLRGYTQCHFFAGIGGWSYALRLAGWPDDRPVWTGSCPCQPFSAAGKQRAADDDRHLWPTFFRLIRECRPGTVFGEQVAGAAGYAWWDVVAADLEGEDYAAAAADIGAHSVGAPHLRQRLYWVADGTQVRRREERADGRRGGAGDDAQGWSAGFEPSGDAAGAVAHAQRRPAERYGHELAAQAGGAEGEAQQRQRIRDDARNGCEPEFVAHDDEAGCGQQRIGGILDGERPAQRHAADRCGEVRWMGDARGEGPQRCERSEDVELHRGAEPLRPVAASGAFDQWSDLEWIPCSDGKARPTQPGLFPLVDGLPKGLVRGGDRSMAPDADSSAEGRMMRLRGYGNAIVPHLAAMFARAAWE